MRFGKKRRKNQHLGEEYLLYSEGKYVWVYWSDNNSCRESIWIQGGKAINAHWAGDCIIVSMADGKVRRYESFGTYTVM